MTQSPAAVIILAAGDGTRMKSATTKVLHRIGGRSLLGHAIHAARGTGTDQVCVVVRSQRDRVAEAATDIYPEVVIADQDDIYGTGRATECGLLALPEVSGTVLVTMGDVPLLTSETLVELSAAHAASGSAVTVITATMEVPTGLGRIIRDDEGAVVGIIEEKDASDEERLICEINTGLYAFDAELLRGALTEVGTNNAAGEKYLTDVVSIATSRGLRVSGHLVEDIWQTEGVNDKAQLARLGAELNRRTVDALMRAGAIVIDPATTWVDAEVSIGRDTIVHPNTQILGASTIGEDCVIGPDSTLTDMEVGDRASLVRTQAILSVVGNDAVVGPFAYLRPGTELGAEGKIGGFVETKNATIGKGSKVPHLSYVGDATIGEGTNIGAASVFVNYDGVNKAHTTVGNNCRMGSDNMYVAPVTIGDGAYSGAGTGIRKDVPAGALAINVAPQRNLEGWVLEKRAGTRAAAAAARSLPTDSNASDDTATHKESAQ